MEPEINQGQIFKSGKKIEKNWFIIATVINSVLLIAIIVIFFLFNWYGPINFGKLVYDSTAPDYSIVLERIDLVFTLFTVLVTAVAVIVPLIAFTAQSKSHKEYKEIQETRFDLFEKANSISNLQTKILSDFKKSKEELNALLKTDFDSLKSETSKQIFEKIEENMTSLQSALSKETFLNTKRFVEETLLVIPEYKESVYSTTETYLKDRVTPLITKCCKDENSANELMMVLNELNFVQRAISRVHHTELDKAIIIKGLADLTLYPVKALKPHLLKMKSFYSNDEKVYPYIIDALTAIENAI